MKRVLFVIGLFVLSSGCVNNRFELPKQTEPDMIIIMEWECQ